MAELFMALALIFLSGVATAQTTATGIALDSAWKRQAYEFTKKNLMHPAWGLPHSERNYHLTKQLAAKEGFIIDEEVVFAAAFLHDTGGFAPFAKEETDHAVRSVEVVMPLLKKWGFPAQKIEALKEMILGHVYYGPAPKSPAAQAFRDADILDFMGAIGIARIIAITPETSPSLKPTLDMVRDFRKTMPGACSLETSRTEAKIRAMQMDAFLESVDSQSLKGEAL